MPVSTALLAHSLRPARRHWTEKYTLTQSAGIGFLIWSVVRAGGVGTIVRQPARIRGSELGWQFVKGVMSSIANFSTFVVNDPDFSRFAPRPRDAFWSQLVSPPSVVSLVPGPWQALHPSSRVKLVHTAADGSQFTIPIGFALTSFIGIIVSSSSTVIYGGDPIWDPLDLLEHFISDGDSAQRFGVFVIAAAFALAQLGTNIAANSVSAGTDLTALMPRFINIRRGGYVCAAVGLVMCPYTLLTSSSQFTTYLSAYSVFLSSIAGLMCADYYLVRRGYLQVKELYDARRSGPYFFGVGVNWRAYAAYIAGILINVVGFAGAMGHEVPIGATYIYNLNFFCGFIVAASIYWGLNRVSPVPATSDRWMEVGDAIEEMRLAHDISGTVDSDRAMYEEANLAAVAHKGDEVKRT